MDRCTPDTRPARFGAGCLPEVTGRAGHGVSQGCHGFTGSVEVAAIGWLNRNGFTKGDFEIVR